MYYLRLQLMLARGLCLFRPIASGSPGQFLRRARSLGAALRVCPAVFSALPDFFCAPFPSLLPLFHPALSLSPAFPLSVVFSVLRRRHHAGWDVPDRMPAYTCVPQVVADIVREHPSLNAGVPHCDLAEIPVDLWGV